MEDKDMKTLLLSESFPRDFVAAEKVKEALHMKL